MHVIAYLHFNGNCEEALNFYKDALDGTILQVSRTNDSAVEVDEKDKEKIVHARLKLGDSVIYFSDTFKGNKINAGDNIHLSLQLTDLTIMEKYFDNLSSGGTVVRPLEDTFWGARFGMLIDKFGIHWMMNCELKK